MTALVAVALGLAIGLSLGALGGGGSILTVPALVYVLGEPAQAATAESLVIVGVTSAAAAVAHARAGRVRWAHGTVFAVSGAAASFAGAAANRGVDPDVLLLAFAGLIALAGAAMLKRRPAVPAPSAVEAGGRVGGGAEGVIGALRSPAVAAPSPPPPSGIHGARPSGHATCRDPACLGRLAAAGAAVGFLTGFFGVGGGFVIVPALVMVLGYAMPTAVGTSLLVITVTSAAALLAHNGSGLNWALLVPFLAGAIGGGLAGRRASGFVSPKALTTGFTVLLFAVAAYMSARSFLALTG